MDELQRAIELIENDEVMLCCCEWCEKKRWAFELALEALREKQAREKPMTNFDRIKNMSVEEMADSRIGQIIGILPCPVWVSIDAPKDMTLDKQSALEKEIEWLNSPAGEGV